MDNQAASFLYQCLEDGFDMLRKARVKYTVTKEQEKDTINAWIIILLPVCNWNVKDDHPRICQAFHTIALNDNEFPSPARFIKALPDRIPIPAHRRIQPINNKLTDEEKKCRDEAWAILRAFNEKFIVNKEKRNDSN